MSIGLFFCACTGGPTFATVTCYGNTNYIQSSCLQFFGKGITLVITNFFTNIPLPLSMLLFLSHIDSLYAFVIFKVSHDRLKKKLAIP